jgi:integrase
VANIKFTKRKVAGLRAPDPTGHQVLHWDEETKGFGVLVSGRTNVKSYVVQHRLSDGRSRRVTIGPCNVLDLEEARERAKAVIAEIYGGGDPKRARRATPAGTLRKTLEDYLAARRNLSEKSRREYRAQIERHLQDWLGIPVREITADMVEAKHAEIKRSVERRAKGRALVNGGATANAVFRAFRALWNFASDRDPGLGRNPVPRLRGQWYPVARRVRLVRSDQLPAFCAAVRGLPNPIHRDYLLLLLFTGLRRGEAAALRWDEIDFAMRTIRLPATRTKAGQKLDLPMSDFVHDLLTERRQVGRDASGFVFPANSESGHIEEPKYPLRLVAEETGIAVSAHDLRRTFITVAEATDISPLALKALVNHAIGGDVTAGYVMMTLERLREPAQRVGERMKELCGAV